jgi:maleate isomerase
MTSVITVGVLTPHAAAGPEAELPDMAAGQVFTLVSRIPAIGATVDSPGTPPTSPSGLRALAAPAALDAAAAVFAPGSVDVIGYASTSTGYAIGFDAEAAMVDRLAQRWNLPVAATSLSAVAALQSFDVERIAVVHPPWFADELNDLGASYFGSQGFEVVEAVSADLPNDPSRIEPDAVVDWISRHVSDDAQAVFIGGSGFRACRAIEALEERLGRPVVASNQTLLWSIIAIADAGVAVVGHGRLFDRTGRSVSGPGESGAIGGK